MILINRDKLLHELQESDILSKSRTVFECFCHIVDLILQQEEELNTSYKINGEVAPCPNCGSMEMKIKIERDRLGFKGTFICLKCGKMYGASCLDAVDIYKLWNHDWGKLHNEMKQEKETLE